MALIIEDGSMPADADSYVSVANARAYAARRGVTLPSSDSDVEVLLINAMDYLQSFTNYKGQKVVATQVLAWPRQSVIIEAQLLSGSWFSSWDSWGGLVAGDFFPMDQIPPQLVAAQCQVAIELNNGIDPLPTFKAGAFVTDDKTDVLETKWTDRFGNLPPQMYKVNALLQPLLNIGAGGLKVVRA